MAVVGVRRVLPGAVVCRPLDLYPVAGGGGAAGGCCGAGVVAVGDVVDDKAAGVAAPGPCLQSGDAACGVVGGALSCGPGGVFVVRVQPRVDSAAVLVCLVDDSSGSGALGVSAGEEDVRGVVGVGVGAADVARGDLVRGLVVRVGERSAAGGVPWSTVGPVGRTCWLLSPSGSRCGSGGRKRRGCS